MSAYIDRAYEVFVPHQDVSHANSKDNGKNPSSHKALHCLFWRQFDELCPAKRDAANIGEDIVANDQRDGQEEPDHSFKNVIHDEMRLDHNKV